MWRTGRRRLQAACCRRGSSPSLVWLIRGIAVSFLPRRDLLLLLHLLVASDHCRASPPSVSSQGGCLLSTRAFLPEHHPLLNITLDGPGQNPHSFLPVPFHPWWSLLSSHLHPLQDSTNSSLCPLIFDPLVSCARHPEYLNQLPKPPKSRQHQSLSRDPLYHHPHLRATNIQFSSHLFPANQLQCLRVLGRGDQGLAPTLMERL